MSDGTGAFTQAELEIDAELAARAETRVVRARRPRDGRSVVVKRLVGRLVSAERRARFKREYEIAAALPVAGVVRPLAYLVEVDGPAIVMVDDGATSCDRFLNAGAFDPLTAVRIGVEVARTLADIHDREIIHKDINPSNIIYRSDTELVRIIDFGRAAPLAWQEVQPAAAAELEGSLAYLAPEQSGRLNRRLDHRCDFYALGATLYALLTGYPPFTETDPLTLLHRHLAAPPPAPSDREPAVPAQFDRIVQCLLAKVPEARYQSAQAIYRDLETVAGALAQGRAVPAFALGQGDMPATLRLPQGLYGRQGELDKLAAAFENAAAGGRCLALVAGEAGVGKSALIHELHRPVLARGGALAVGKFDQLAAERPYSALVEALTGLIDKMLAEPDEALAAWRRQVGASLGENARVMARLVPRLEALLGPQDAPPELDAEAEHNRLTVTLEQFMAAVATPDHPLALFLDDLHWADGASTALLQHLMTQGHSQYLLVVATYRSERMTPGQPIHRLYTSLREQPRLLVEVALAGLPEADIADYLADALYTEPADVASLAAQVYTKTLGNPFFVERLLAQWASDGLLWPDRSAGRWRWDAAAVAASEVADNVVALLTDKLAQLPESAQAHLAWAAVLGNTFDLLDLAAVTGDSPETLLAQLWPAVQGDILLPVDESYRLVGAEDGPAEAWFRFRHERVADAALARLDPADLERARMAVGRVLLGQVGDPDTDTRLFAALGHLNAVEPAMTDEAERIKLARLNRVAAARARQAVAVDRVLAFVRAGLAFLGAAPWQRDYATCLALHDLGAESAWVTDDFETVTRFTDPVLEQAQHARDCVVAWESRAYAHIRAGQHQAGLREGLRGLERFGVGFPEYPSTLQVLLAYRRTERVLGRHRPEAQLERAELADPDRRGLIRLVAALVTPAYLVGSFAYALLTLYGVRLLWRHGNHPVGVKLFSALGVIQTVMGAPVATARRYTWLAAALAERVQSERFRTDSRLSAEPFVECWCRDIAGSAESMRQAAEEGRQSGHFMLACLAFELSSLFAWFTGGQVDATAARIRYNRDIILELWGLAGTWGSGTALGVLENLQRPTAQPTCLHYLTEGDETALFRELLAAGNEAGPFVIALAKVELAMHFGADDEVRRWLPELEGRYRRLGSLYGFRGQCALIWGEGVLAGDRPSWRTRLRLQRRLGKLEASFARIPHQAPFESWVQWARAEVARARGQYRAALAAYDRAAAAADRQGQGDIGGLSRERAAALLIAWDAERLANAYLREAASVYGAHAMEAKVAELTRRFGLRPESWQPDRETPTSDSELDLRAVLDMAQTISRQIQPERLVEQLMRAVSRMSGATHGCLFLGEQAHELAAQVRLDVTANPEVLVLGPPGKPEAEAPPAVPWSVLRYVMRTGELMVLDKPADRASDSDDPYLRQIRPQSILALPLVNQGRPVGVLYLEHRSTAGAFPPERSRILAMLSAQMAISVENARLYGALEDRVAERTAELERLVRSDPLTELANRRHIMAVLHKEFARSKRYGNPLAVLVLDVDRFKDVNDRYGHEAGDNVLIALARFLTEALRNVDTAGRFGGEEFLVLLPETDMVGAEQVAERLRAGAAQRLRTALPAAETAESVTISLGVAVHDGQVRNYPDADALLREADNNCLTAKQAGRNRAVG